MCTEISNTSNYFYWLCFSSCKYLNGTKVDLLQHYNRDENTNEDNDSLQPSEGDDESDHTFDADLYDDSSSSDDTDYADHSNLSGLLDEVEDENTNTNEAQDGDGVVGRAGGGGGGKSAKNGRGGESRGGNISESDLYKDKPSSGTNSFNPKEKIHYDDYPGLAQQTDVTGPVVAACFSTAVVFLLFAV